MPAIFGTTAEFLQHRLPWPPGRVYNFWRRCALSAARSRPRGRGQRAGCRAGSEPVVLIYENVAQFAKKDPVWQTIPLLEFVNQLKEIRDPNGDPVYTHFKVFTMSPHQFVSNLHRERIYLVASGLAFGRDKAVDEVDEVMEESQQTRTQQETVQARVQEGGYMIHKQKGCVCQENQDLRGDVHTANGRKADREAEFPAGGVCATTATNSALAGDFFVVAVCTWIVVRLK